MVRIPMRGQSIGLFMAKEFWVFLVQVLWYLASLAVPENYFSGCALGPAAGIRIPSPALRGDPQVILVGVAAHACARASPFGIAS
jgi:hypothetical protein